MKTNQEKFLELVSNEDPKSMERNRKRIRRRWWKRPLQQIHLRFLILRDKILKR
jgi:hypothetical protein